MAGETRPVLELRDVGKHFSAHRAVDGVSIAVERGELFALVGPSGCGKTTTLRLVAGFEQPTRGEVLLEGEPIAHLPPYRRNVSTVFQNYALFPHLSARENIEFGLRRQDAGSIGPRVDAVVDLVQLRGKEARKPAQLSGGERQRVALARSLVIELAVLLLDEPLAALDPNLRKQVRGELRSLQRRTGVTFVIVTHDQAEALSMADRMAVMHEGRIQQTGTPRELYLRPRTRFVAGFLGAVNWVDGVGVRPENVRLSPGNGRAREAVVERCVFLGNCTHVEMRLPGGETLVAEMPGSAVRFSPGERVQAWWDPGDELHPEDA